MKKLVLIGVLFFAGCAAEPKPETPPACVRNPVPERGFGKPICEHSYFNAPCGYDLLTQEEWDQR
tara:strand:+ start:279 stop:473 length:195 start_codon:yes stop_codon:yes gene_type:complete